MNGVLFIFKYNIRAKMTKSISAILLLLITVTTVYAQNVKFIKLKQQKINYIPTHYYIAGIIDSRNDTTTMGTMKLGVTGKYTSMNLQGGVTNSLTQFIAKNVVQDTTLAAVWLHVDKLSVTEKVVKTTQQVDVDALFSFYYDGQKLVEYSGNGYQRGTFDMSGYVGQLIIRSLESSIIQFDEWMAENKQAVLEKPSVKVQVAMATETEDNDWILYSKQKPLALTDFQGAPDELSVAAAATYSVVSVGYEMKSLGRQISVNVKVSVYFDKSKSWCKPYARKQRTLEHEQGHFDIAAIKACELVQAIRNYSFSVDNYQKEIIQLQKQNQKEITQLQNDYDKETNHGATIAIQEKWNRKIKEQLANTLCY